MSLDLQISKAVPAHVQIEKYLRQQIESGALPPGERLPTNHELAQSRYTDKTTYNTMLARLEAGEGYSVELYNPDGTMKPPHELRRLFIGAGADPDKPFVASCGSGVTANSLIFAARQLGNRDSRLYDGSWSEWGADPSTPKETGPA